MLTVEERIALRTNPQLAQERVLEQRRVKASVLSKTSEVTPWVDEFVGKTHPELFLPHEVFREFINLAFKGPPRASQIVREGFAPEVRRHQLPADFWERLQSISAVYVADLWADGDLLAAVQQQSGNAKRRAEQALALKQTDVCRSRADALAAARREFGQERLDRFLYEVMAVNMFHSADRLLDAEQLRKAERGCR
jgi:hypothetical protein